MHLYSKGVGRRGARHSLLPCGQRRSMCALHCGQEPVCCARDSLSCGRLPCRLLRLQRRRLRRARDADDWAQGRLCRVCSHLLFRASRQCSRACYRFHGIRPTILIFSSALTRVTLRVAGTGVPRQHADLQIISPNALGRCSAGCRCRKRSPYVPGRCWRGGRAVDGTSVQDGGRRQAARAGTAAVDGRPPQGRCAGAPPSAVA